MEQVVLKEVKEGIHYIRLNRPGRLNAMDMSLLEGLLQALQGAEREGVGVVAITGEGRAFSAGADLVEFRAAEDPFSVVHQLAGVLHQVIAQVRRMSPLVVALVNGPAVGAGFSLSLACDLAIASEEAYFDMAYMRIALTPDGGGSLSLPRIIGLKRAMEVFLLTEPIPAREAKELGLVNYVFPPERLYEEAHKLLLRLLTLPRRTVMALKELVNESLFPDLEAHLVRERTLIAEMAAEEEFRKRVEDFFRKREG